MAERPELIVREEIPVPVGQPTVKEVRKWIDAQVPYRNFAGMHDNLDQSVREFVFSRRERFRARTSGAMGRWAVHWAAYNDEVTWAEREDDVHMPETRKAVDAKVTKVEEQITAFDPVFETEGTRGKQSRKKAAIVGQYVYRHMELSQWRRFIKPAAKDGELCNFMGFKIDWEQRAEDMVDREDEMSFRKDGTPYYTAIRRMSRRVVRRGPRMTPIDPFLAIWDLDATVPEEGAFIGDESEPFLHELEEMAEFGTYDKALIAKVKTGHDDQGGSGSLDQQARASWPDLMRNSRSIALGSYFSPDIRSEHGAVRVRQIEMWAWFDFKDGYDGVVDPRGKKLKGVQRVVMTVANGIVIRLQQNPFDRKFVPYAIETVNPNGHEGMAPAPMAAAVQMNANYDRWMSIVMKQAELAVAPLIITEDQNSDLPDNILDVDAGTVMKNTGRWGWIKAPDVTNTVNYMQGMFRREMEETSGALRVYESSPETATETERKVQEQQRSVRDSITAMGNLLRKVAIIYKNMLAQYATKAEQFKVAGKGAMILGEWATVTPDMLQEEVDFRILGLADIHVLGNQLQGINTVMNAWGPLLPQIPRVDMMELFRWHVELAVGRNRIDRIMPHEESPYEVWTQVEENEILMSGIEVPVHKNDDDDTHIDETVKLLKLLTAQKAPKYVVNMAVKHLNDHLRQKDQKMAEEEALMQQKRKEARMLQQTGGRPGIDVAPGPGGMEAQGKPQNETPGVTPGPRQDRTVAKTGRKGSGESQTERMAS